MKVKPRCPTSRLRQEGRCASPTYRLHYCRSRWSGAFEAVAMGKSSLLMEVAECEMAWGDALTVKFGTGAPLPSYAPGSGKQVAITKPMTGGARRSVSSSPLAQVRSQQQNVATLFCFCVGITQGQQQEGHARVPVPWLTCQLVPFVNPSPRPRCWTGSSENMLSAGSTVA